MKIYVYFLTFLLTFAPVYANAVLPLVTAVSGSTAGRVVVTKGTESFLRTVAPTAFKKIGKNVVGICAKNAGALLACGVITSAIKGDGWTISVKNETNNNDVDVEIYKLKEPTSSCNLEFGYTYSSIDKPTVTGFSSFYTGYLSFLNSLNNGKTYSAHSPMYATVNDFENRNSSLSSNVVEEWTQIGMVSSLLANYNEAGQNVSGAFTNYLYGYYRCTPYSSTPKIYMQEYEINNYFTKNVSDDDIINIYNYDYSKHQTIKINNNFDSGDTVNNYKNDTDSIDKKISKNASDKSKAKNPDYHPDKINDDNCDKDDTGAYDKCGADRDKDDDDDTASAPASTPTPTDPPEEEDDDDDPPIECNSNGFYKKVCDWMDWTQEQPTKPTDEKPPVKEVEAENSNKIDLDGSCPAPYQINFSVFGHSQNNSISYQPLCDALEMLKPIFVGAGALSSMFILMGYSRPNSTGVND